MTFTVEQQWESAREIWRMHQIRSYLEREAVIYQAQEDATISPGEYDVAHGRMMAITMITNMVGRHRVENIFPVTHFTSKFTRTKAQAEQLRHLLLTIETLLFDPAEYPHHLQQLDHFTADPEQTWDKPPAEKEG